MTFREIYQQKKAEPSRFIKEVATAAKVSEQAVRQWIGGSFVPNRYAMDILERMFGISADELFPSRVKQQSK